MQRRGLRLHSGHDGSFVPPDADVPRPPGTRCLLIIVPTLLAAAATVVFGVYPDPLVDWAANAGESLAAGV